MRGLRRRLGPLVLAAAVATSAAACGAVGGGSAGPAPLRSGPAVTYVAVSDVAPPSTEDVRSTWPALFASSSLPAWAVAYQVVLPTDWLVGEAAVVSQVMALHPTVVTLAIGTAEASQGLATVNFSAALRALLDAFHRARVPTVLVANLPPASDTGTPSDLTASIGAYNTAIAADAGATGAILVDAHAVFSRALGAGKDVLTLGGGLTLLGQQLLASAFRAGAKHRRLWR